MKVKAHSRTASTSSGLSTELNISQNKTRHAYLEEINRTLRLHQTDISSKRSAQRQYNKRDQMLIKCMTSQCYVQHRFKLTFKLLKSEVQMATATYTFLFYENVTSVIVISSAIFRI
jgi:hypothetical protein